MENRIVINGSQINDRIGFLAEVRTTGMFGRIIEVDPVLAILFVVVDVVYWLVAKKIDDGLLQPVKCFFIAGIHFRI